VASDGVSAAPEQLQDAAKGYGVSAEKVQQVYKTLVTALEAQGACWGDDDAGRQFGAKYCPPALSLLQQMSNTNQGIASMVDGICSWAKGYLNADEASKANASQITSPGTSTYRPPNYTGIDAAANSGG
jgi:uncharacterized protein YukE